MNRRHVRHAAALTVALALATTVHLSKADPSSTGALVVEVSGFANRAGALRCGLWSSQVGFPDTGAVKQQTVKLASGGQVRCEFDGLLPGTYAVAVYHDANDNGRLDKGLFGVPKEGYGVSNNKTYAMSAPKWGESVFAVGSGEKKTLTIQLRN